VAITGVAFFIFYHRTQQQNTRVYAAITRLQTGMLTEQKLMDLASRARVFNTIATVPAIRAAAAVETTSAHQIVRFVPRSGSFLFMCRRFLHPCHPASSGVDTSAEITKALASDGINLHLYITLINGRRRR